MTLVAEAVIPVQVHAHTIEPGTNAVWRLAWFDVPVSQSYHGSLDSRCWGTSTLWGSHTGVTAEHLVPLIRDIGETFAASVHVTVRPATKLVPVCPASVVGTPAGQIIRTLCHLTRA